MDMANCTGADFSAADLSMACGRGILFTRANLFWAHLRQVYFKHCFFDYANCDYADFARGFFLGSPFNGAKIDKIRNAETAVFRWWRPKDKGPISYYPQPGYVEVNWSDTGTLSFQENAGHRRVDL
jgi:UDP:flavonoid glycosyltransferase YjiC (YdhE family)